MGLIRKFRTIIAHFCTGKTNGLGLGAPQRTLYMTPRGI